MDNSKFKPFKLAGTDRIVPALLQQGVNHLMTHLCHIFRVNLARGYIPKIWRQIKVTFIPKPGRANCTVAKAYCPIILLSFMLKIMEILVDRDIRDKIFRIYPIHANQPWKSTETAPHHIIEHIAEAVEQRDNTHWSFPRY